MTIKSPHSFFPEFECITEVLSAKSLKLCLLFLPISEGFWQAHSFLLISKHSFNAFTALGNISLQIL